MQKGYIGTYNTEFSRGVYSFSFDEQTGRLFDARAFCSADDAKCVDAGGGYLFAGFSRDGSGGMALADCDTGRILSSYLAEHKPPCFIKYADGFIYTANYHDGTVMAYRLLDSAIELVKRIDIMPKAGCHQVIVHGRYIIVPCLLLDELRIFDSKNDFSLVKIMPFDKGTGPRHGIFNAAHSRFYLVSEYSNELFAFEADGLSFNLTKRINLLSAEQQPGSSSAALRLSPDERYLYISTRGADLLTVISLQDKNSPCTIQQISCGGRHPRDFTLAGDGRYLLCVNRDSDDLISFSIDSISGRIGRIIDRLPVPHGVGICMKERV